MPDAIFDKASLLAAFPEMQKCAPDDREPEFYAEVARKFAAECPDTINDRINKLIDDIDPNEEWADSYELFKEDHPESTLTKRDYTIRQSRMVNDEIQRFAELFETREGRKELQQSIQTMLLCELSEPTPFEQEVLETLMAMCDGKYFLDGTTVVAFGTRKRRLIVHDEQESKKKRDE